MATIDVIQYYANLLIIQYLGQPRALATVASSITPVLMPDSNVQSIAFIHPPNSGNFKLEYNSVQTASLSWNDNAATIQTSLNAILVSPLSVGVTGSIASGLVFTFSNYSSVVLNLSVTANTLLDQAGNPVQILVTPIGEQLPFEVQNAFNVSGPNTAVGVQLDILGKYVGVTRNGYGFNNPISLDDTDFLTLIQMAILRNKSGSSLATIQFLLNQFFPGEVLLTDYADMHMSYLINTSIGSQNLIQLFVTEGLLPKPMGVGISVIAAPIIDMFFVFVTYDVPTSSIGTPFNTYDSYNTSWLWLSYSNSVSA